MYSRELNRAMGHLLLSTEVRMVHLHPCFARGKLRHSLTVPKLQELEGCPASCSRSTAKRCSGPYLGDS